MLLNIKEYILQKCRYEKSPHKLALTAAVGVYIALCPFFGLHTFLVFASGLVFNVNVPLVFIISNAVNNPFTMVPIYVGGYAWGFWLLHSFFCLPVIHNYPPLLTWFVNFIAHYLPLSGISFWAFLIGGNSIALILALLSYVVLKPLFFAHFKKNNGVAV